MSAVGRVRVTRIARMVASRTCRMASYLLVGRGERIRMVVGELRFTQVMCSVLVAFSRPRFTGVCCAVALFCLRRPPVASSVGTPCVAPPVRPRQEQEYAQPGRPTREFCPPGAASPAPPS